MSRSEPRIFFGVHNFTPYNYKTGEAYGSVEVIKGSSFNATGEIIQLNAGSSKYPWAAEEGNITAELNVKPAEYPDFLFELFMGKKPTSNAAEANGSVTTLENKFGALVESTTGVASIGIKSGSESDLKFGKYVMKAVSATTVIITPLSNVDFANGATGEYLEDDLRISAPLTIAGTGGVTEVPNFGLQITGGSGAIALTEGDTAIFNVRPPNQKSTEVIIGGTSDVFPTFGAIVMGQKRGSGQMVQLDIFKLKAVGLPLGFEEKAFSESEITATASYDSDQKGVFKMDIINP